jgi:hypothetical protein
MMLAGCDDKMADDENSLVLGANSNDYANRAS